MISKAKKVNGINIIIKTNNKDKMIDKGLIDIFLIRNLYTGKETYAKRMLPRRIVIIGWISLKKRRSASMNMIKGTIFS